MHRISQLGLALGLAVLPALSQAVTVSSVFTPVSGSTWNVALTLDTSGASSGIPGLAVYFDETLFGSLSSAVAPTGWDPLLLQPDLGLPAAGVFDALALDTALAPGQTLAGFSVNVSYLGSGTPGALPYQLYAVDGGGNVNVLYNGVTTPVPEPATSWLMALGVAGFAFGAHRIAARRLA